MPGYRFYQFGAGGRCMRFEDCDCSTDTQAVAQASLLLNNYGIEVWERGGRRIRRIAPEEANGDASDR